MDFGILSANCMRTFKKDKSQWPTKFWISSMVLAFGRIEFLKYSNLLCLICTFLISFSVEIFIFLMEFYHFSCLSVCIGTNNKQDNTALADLTAQKEILKFQDKAYLS